MIGITAYGAYIPRYRLGPPTSGWTAPTERAVANNDEDAITMAVAAALDCLAGGDSQAVDGLIFATTTSPYREKQAASLVATAADLRQEILALDLTNSLRGGTIALRQALDSVKSGAARQVLVTASDLRVPQPRSELDTVFGDGAAALLVGSSGVIAAVEDSYSLVGEILDMWRAEGDRLVRSWEDRFIMEEGYLRLLPQALSTLMKRNGLAPKDLAKVVFYAPDSRRHREVAAKLGFAPQTLMGEPLFRAMGNTGTAFALMMLVAALEEAKPGELILLANYGDGADAFLLRATEEIEKIGGRRGVKGHLKSKESLKDYETYARWRGLIEVAPPSRRPPLQVPSVSALWREQDKNIRLYGVRCLRCGSPQYPPQRVCTFCHAKDAFEPYRFSDKGGELYTYTMDYLAPTPDPPLVIAVVNFQGGGRMLCMMTDRDIGAVRVGMPVEMSFRKLYSTEGIHNYYWKCVPAK